MNPNTRALELMERSLTLAEDAANNATDKLAALIAICATTQTAVAQNHAHVIEAIDRLGAVVSKTYEAVFQHEARIATIEQDRRATRNGHADAE